MTLTKLQLEHITLALVVIGFALFLTVYFAARAGAAVGTAEAIEIQTRNRKGPRVFPLPRKS